MNVPRPKLIHAPRPGMGTVADPVCVKSPHHGLVLEAVQRAEAGVAVATEHPLVFRDPKNSRRLSSQPS